LPSRTAEHGFCRRSGCRAAQAAAKTRSGAADRFAARNAAVRCRLRSASAVPHLPAAEGNAPRLDTAQAMTDANAKKRRTYA